MSTHIQAAPGDIAPRILLPGDPKRAEHIAATLLENATCYNRVRGMSGFTGTVNGLPVSVQGTGMGMPSAAIYIHELLRDYGVTHLIRIGSCGSLDESVRIRDLVLARGACTDSGIFNQRFPHGHYAATPDFDLLRRAAEIATAGPTPVHVANVLTSDQFYPDNPDAWKKWHAYGCLAVDMETAELYALAARYRVCALSILTVSDSLITREHTSSEEREHTFNQMVQVALSTLTA